MSALQKRPLQFVYHESSAADYCNVSTQELQRLRESGTGPVSILSQETGEHCYQPEALNAWLHFLRGGDAA